MKEGMKGQPLGEHDVQELVATGEDTTKLTSRSWHRQRRVSVRHICIHAACYCHAHPWLAQTLRIYARCQRCLLGHSGSVPLDPHAADERVVVPVVERTATSRPGLDANNCTETSSVYNLTLFFPVQRTNFRYSSHAVDISTAAHRPLLPTRRVRPRRPHP